MKVTTESVIKGALNLVNRIGLDDLTLRLLARELKIKPATIYWHFKSKRELIDAMADSILAEAAPRLVRSPASPDWRIWIAVFGFGLRRTLLAYRDGARLVAGTQLNNPEYLSRVERIAQKLTTNGFELRQVVSVISTAYNFTLSFVMEEQAVFPRPKQRSPLYNISKRNKKLHPEKFPILRKTNRISLEHFDLRFREGFTIILNGANRLPRSLPAASIR